MFSITCDDTEFSGVAEVVFLNFEGNILQEATLIFEKIYDFNDKKFDSICVDRIRECFSRIDNFPMEKIQGLSPLDTINFQSKFMEIDIYKETVKTLHMNFHKK